MLISSTVHKHDHVSDGTMACNKHELRLFACFQKHSTNAEYYKMFKVARDLANITAGRLTVKIGYLKEKLLKLKDKVG